MGKLSTDVKKVIIIQRRLTHYRVSFFQLLRQELKERGIELHLLIGVGTPVETEKVDSGDISWAINVPTSYFFNNKLCWQSVQKYLNDVRLVIAPQENGLIANHLMTLFPRNYRFAYWGHGANLQSVKPSGLREKFKQWSTSRADWFFAYTQLSAELVLKHGFSADHVTTVNNSIDTSELRRQLKSVTAIETLSLKASMDFSEGPVGVYVGSLYSNKRVDFLLSCAVSIRLVLDNFNLLIIGDGPERNRVRSFCEEHSWAHWVGMRQGREKAVYLSIGDIMLNPGAVGLSILDSFASEMPLLTTDCRMHGPEIAYLENWHNGVMTTNTAEDYVDTAIKLLDSLELLVSLQKGCVVSAKKFTEEMMVKKFSDGVLDALSFHT